MNKTRLIESIQSGYKGFKTLMAGLRAGQIIQPGAVGEWSVKDILAHILVHEQRMIEWLEGRLGGEIPAVSQPYGMAEAELALVNQQIHQESRDRPLAEILSGLDETHVRVLRLVREAVEEDLFDAHRFALQDGEPLWEAAAANTFWHYEEHGRDIRAWLENELPP